MYDVKQKKNKTNSSPQGNKTRAMALLKQQEAALKMGPQKKYKSRKIHVKLMTSKSHLFVIISLIYNEQEYFLTFILLK